MVGHLPIRNSRPRTFGLSYTAQASLSPLSTCFHLIFPVSSVTVSAVSVRTSPTHTSPPTPKSIPAQTSLNPQTVGRVHTVISMNLKRNRLCSLSAPTFSSALLVPSNGFISFTFNMISRCWKS